MNIISTILIIFVALEFFLYCTLKRLLQLPERPAETFNISVDKLKDKIINVLLKNQGIYNGLIGVLLIYGLFISSNPKENMRSFILVYIIGVAIYGGLSSNISIFFQTRHIASIGIYQCFGKYWCFGVWRCSRRFGGIWAIWVWTFRLRVFQPNFQAEVTVALPLFPL